LSPQPTGHPGAYIRAEIFPKGMSVTIAAKTLNIGRSALSNVLNGKAALSSELATRIERAFGASARALLDMQAAFDARLAREKGAAAIAKAYVPPFLQFKANDIQEWAGSLRARSRLAVFVRTLIHSTGAGLRKVEFHGNDDAERPGWDGFVEADEGTPWIPVGKSGWEFGVSKDPKEKADGDYAKALGQVPEEEWANIAFVFVTPRRWPGKTAWESSRRKDGKWKDVRVMDASNLEEWLEQSIPAQTWFANELGLPSDGLLSLDECWRKWVADCEPAPTQELFDPAIEKARLLAKAGFSKGPDEPLVVTADSVLEALAFLHCVFSPDVPELSALRDRAVAFTTSGALAKLASKSSRFIAVVTNRDVEKELAQHKDSLHSIIIYPRNATNADPDIALEPLSGQSFDKALQTMGLGRDEIDRLGHESGRSLTVLRRRLSNLEAIRSPEWAADQKAANSLAPFLFAGAWKSNNEADQTILEFLANETRYAKLESNLATLVQLEDAPLWVAGAFRGLVSKIDVLFAIHKNIVADDIKRFLNVAHLVLSEDDPSLDMPEDRQWTAAMYGKTREISGPLRQGISETLVLLAVYGNSLFRDRFGMDLEVEIGRLIKSLLTPLTTRGLEAHSGDLPMYAEAAPHAFLELLEHDLETGAGQTLGLLRPASSGVFGRCPRTGLLWALENIAWSPAYLCRTILVLARLAEIKIEDNWSNKPISSLSAVFRSWMPQTSAPLQKRIAALRLLAEKYPKIAWTICVKQFEARSRTGMYSNKPRWRSDGQGHGEPVTPAEAYEFSRAALDMALAWKTHDRETLGDLVANVSHLSEADQYSIWGLVDEWSKSATEEDKSWMREKIRVGAFTQRAVAQNDKHGKAKEKLIERARNAYESLLPSDVILKHAWLFQKHWIHESLDELEDGKFDIRKREERITALRKAALREILEQRGLDGVVSLAEQGETSGLIGWILNGILSSTEELILAIRHILDVGPLASSPSRRQILFGMLGALGPDQAAATLLKLIEKLEENEFVPVLSLCPFNGSTWAILATMSADVRGRYWREVQPQWMQNPSDELQFAVDHLLSAGRPRAAFHLVHFELEKLQPRQLFSLMGAMASSRGEEPEAFPLEGYSIRKAFDQLNKSGEIADDEMAGLEYRYIEVLDDDEGSGVPNLERQIEKHPHLYVQAVMLAFRRADDGHDPEEFQLSDPEQRSRRAIVAYRVLERLSRIPGWNKVGELGRTEIEEWVGQVRAGCKEVAREDVCDSSLGKLFSKAPIGEDGIWPCKPVRDALEKVTTDALSDGLTTALYNARGVQWRGEGGGQERELSDKYRKWAQALEFTHPRVSRIHTKMVAMYDHEAKYYDTEAAVNRRLRN
jgi:addiction module HigA family antidote